ncbi:MAG: hypothetical protein ACM3S0_01175, partial [Acidobacteriota bacterium]
GLSFIRFHIERRWQLLGAVSVLAGGFALSGIPPVPAVAARWGIYHDLVVSHPLVLILLLGSSAVALLATVRIIQPIFVRPDEMPVSTGEVKIVPYLCAGVVVALIAALIVIGLFPQLLTEPLLAILGRAEYLK